MSFFWKWRTNRRLRKARSGSYGRIVAWVEEHYGPIHETDYYWDVKSKFDQALEHGLATGKPEKALRGLKRYIDEERFRRLLRES